MIYGSHSNRLSRHAEYHTAGFVLCDGDSAGLLHLQHSGGAVAAHARQQHSNGLGPGVLGYRTKHDVNRRTLVTDAWAVFHGHAVPSRTFPQQHVEVSRGHQGQAWTQMVSVHRLPYFKPAD